MGFSFHANTLAFGGQVEPAGSTRPKYLASEASVTLPPTGGIGEAVSGPYDNEGVSYLGARSYVTGSAVGRDAFNTYASVTVTELDIQGRIQAQVLNTTVTSMNRRDASGCIGESRIWFDANIIGLVIDGHLIEVDFNPEPFRRWGTFDEFVRAFPNMPPDEAKGLIDAYNWPIEECTDPASGKYQIPSRCSTGIRASLLRSTTPALAPGEINGITRRGFTIEVAGFGLIHLGEVLLKAGRRRMNLMRVELNKTFDDKVMVSAPLAESGGAPRLVASGMDAAPDLIAAVPELGGGGGTYTFASGEGNGTDFVP